jgi:hypothetical protein
MGLCCAKREKNPEEIEDFIQLIIDEQMTLKELKPTKRNEIDNSEKSFKYNLIIYSDKFTNYGLYQIRLTKINTCFVELESKIKAAFSRLDIKDKHIFRVKYAPKLSTIWDKYLTLKINDFVEEVKKI